MSQMNKVADSLLVNFTSRWGLHRVSLQATCEYAACLRHGWHLIAVRCVCATRDGTSVWLLWHSLLARIAMCGWFRMERQLKGLMRVWCCVPKPLRHPSSSGFSSKVSQLNKNQRIRTFYVEEIRLVTLSVLLLEFVISQFGIYI